MSTSRKASVGASGTSTTSAMEKEKSVGGSGGGGGGGSGMERVPNSTSKAYSSHLAVQTDATKYRGKYKELKKRVRQIEMENDKLHFKTLRIKRNIQRMRLERAILYERLEAELGENAALVEEGESPSTRMSNGASNVRIPQETQQAEPQPSHSTPSGRRVIDYSPSPEDTKPAGVAAAANASTSESQLSATITNNGEARQGMKVTLKRNNHANGKEPSW